MNYDDVPFNREIVLDLPFREATGIITQDVAKPHHPVALVNTPAWASLDTELSVLSLDGATEYLQSLNADTADLEFTSGDYSLSVWLRWESGDASQIVMGRWELDVGGWEVYLFSPTNLLTLRHHHAGGAATRTGIYSDGWTQNAWHHMGISRTGVNAVHYRNGVALTMTGELEDPESTTRDLVVGVRYTKDANFFKGKLWRPRAWNRALSAAEWAQIYERERRWFA